jgi:serine/threonine-protein kinase haspin
MPPKIVYGKKKSTTRTTTSFSKFVSPEKRDGATQENVGKSVVDGQTDSRQPQPRNAAGEALQEDAVAVLAKGLGGLRLEQTQTGEDVQTKKKGRPRKAAQHHNTIEAKGDGRAQHNNSDEGLGATSEQGQMEVSQLEAATRVTKVKRRVALETCDANSKASIGYTLEDHSIKGTTCRAADILLPSPTKQHKPRAELHSKTNRKPPLPTPEPTTGSDNVYSNYALPLLSLSDGKKVESFQHWSSELEPHFQITKIAEASFSEVYRLSAIHPASTSNQESVLKVVALKTPPNAPLPCQLHTRTARDRQGQVAKEMAEREESDQWKSEVTDVLSEVKLLQNLNHIPGFTNFRDLTILQGRPSPAFGDAWRAWNKSRARGKKSEFPDPSKKASYDDTQLWAIIEMQDAGTDCEKIMENGGLSSIWEVWDVFWGVCLSVAKAEETCNFEHRDLHMGNICVRSLRAEGDITQVTIEDPIRRKFRFTGLDTTVIDYTLSRADILPVPTRQSAVAPVCVDASSSSNLDASEPDVAWLDLNKDPALFEGDASEEYQYEIYRYMRGAALYGKPLQNTPTVVPGTPRRSPRKNTHIRFDGSGSPCRASHKSTYPDSSRKILEDFWKGFHPKTNLVWAHFLLHKLLTHLDTSGNTPKQLSTKQLMTNVQTIDEPMKIRKKASKLYSILKRVSELLCPIALGREESLGSVKELVVLALEERWLRVGDVAA